MDRAPGEVMELVGGSNPELDAEGVRPAGDIAG